MKTSIHDRKLNIIENVPLIKDDELIKKIEKLIAKSIANEFHEPTKEYLISKAQQAVISNIYTELTQEQFVALTSFTFNLGYAALQRSTLRQKVNRNEHFQVPKELMRWVYSSGKILPGLVRRREAEAELYML